MSQHSKVKQIIVMRTDLGMSRGKMVAQGAHASIAWMTRRMKPIRQDERDVPEYLRGTRPIHGGILTMAEKEWINTAFTKICLRVDSLEAMDEIYDAAMEAKLEVHRIVDKGWTEFGGALTPTCLGIGPDFSDKIDEVTGHLKVLQ